MDESEDTSVAQEAEASGGHAGPGGTIESVIAPSVTGMGYEIVRVMLTGGRSPVLQVMAERVDRVPMTVEDCADISRTISAVLDVADPIAGAYTLEVSSPGIDRPLTRLTDYDRFAGHEARIDLRAPLGGRKRFRGIVKGTEGESILVAEPEGVAALPFSAILRAKLVLTDALIAAAST